MIREGETKCPYCSGTLKFYDVVKRQVKEEYGEIKIITIRRLRCDNCRRIHRELPDEVLPYKQYDAKIIFGFVTGLFSSYDLQFEDFPSAITISRWIHLYSHSS